MFYDSTQIYIQCARTKRQKIARIDALITAMEDAALKVATGAEVKEYSLDDGQTKVMNVFSSMNEMVAGIKSLMELRNLYSSGLNGRIFTLVDSKNLNGR